MTRKKVQRVARRDEDVVARPEDFDPEGALTREFLLKRGHCCREGCRNCPYGFLPAGQ